MMPQGGMLHHVLRKLPLYMRFHLGPGLVLFNRRLFHFQISEGKLGDRDVVKWSLLANLSRVLTPHLALC